MNTFGKHFRVTTFGESHGMAYGAVVDGCPAGLCFSKEVIRKLLDRRRPGYFPWQSSRKEEDHFEVLSGVYEDKTLGTPIAMVVQNKNARPQDYSEIKVQPRKGHADDLWKDKFGHSDYRGGGRASGRETVSRVLAGGIAQMFLQKSCPKLQILSFASQIGDISLKTSPKEMDNLWSKRDSNHFFPNESQFEEVKQLLISGKEQGQSYGGLVDARIKGVPRGLGQPVFSKLKSDLSSALMGIGACSGIYIGPIEPPKEGSLFHKEETNYGGIRGGLSTGEIVEIRLTFKPPSSIGKVAQSGRHDPCIIPRVIPVIESMIYLVLADHVLAQRLDQI